MEVDRVYGWYPILYRHSSIQCRSLSQFQSRSTVPGSTTKMTRTTSYHGKQSRNIVTYGVEMEMNGMDAHGIHYHALVCVSNLRVLPGQYLVHHRYDFAVPRESHGHIAHQQNRDLHVRLRGFPCVSMWVPCTACMVTARRWKSMRASGGLVVWFCSPCPVINFTNYLTYRPSTITIRQALYREWMHKYVSGTPLLQNQK